LVVNSVTFVLKKNRVGSLELPYIFLGGGGRGVVNDFVLLPNPNKTFKNIQKLCR
jgi:hypothetical protein